MPRPAGDLRRHGRKFAAHVIDHRLRPRLAGGGLPEQEDVAQDRGQVGMMQHQHRNADAGKRFNQPQCAAMRRRHHNQVRREGGDGLGRIAQRTTHRRLVPCLGRPEDAPADRGDARFEPEGEGNLDVAREDRDDALRRFRQAYAPPEGVVQGPRESARGRRPRRSRPERSGRTGAHADREAGTDATPQQLHRLKRARTNTLRGAPALPASCEDMSSPM